MRTRSFDETPEINFHRFGQKYKAEICSLHRQTISTAKSNAEIFRSISRLCEMGIVAEIEKNIVGFVGYRIWDFALEITILEASTKSQIDCIKAKLIQRVQQEITPDSRYQAVQMFISMTDEATRDLLDAQKFNYAKVDENHFGPGINAKLFEYKAYKPKKRLEEFESKTT